MESTRRVVAGVALTPSTVSVAPQEIPQAAVSPSDHDSVSRSGDSSTFDASDALPPRAIPGPAAGSRAGSPPALRDGQSSNSDTAAPPREPAAGTQPPADEPAPSGDDTDDTDEDAAGDAKVNKRAKVKGDEGDSKPDKPEKADGAAKPDKSESDDTESGKGHAKDAAHFASNDKR